MKLQFDEQAFAAVISFAYGEGWEDRDNMAKLEKDALSDTPGEVDFSRPLAPPPDPAMLANRVQDIGVRIIQKMRARKAPPQEPKLIVLPREVM